jgi:hypothetical protein
MDMDGTELLVWSAWTVAVVLLTVVGAVANGSF